MSGQFRQKNRNGSMRHPFWDYRSAYPYFVTICTKNREHFFGKIARRRMHLSAMGEIAESEWIRTPVLRIDMNLILGAYVVMPDHFHGIIKIGGNAYNDFGASEPYQVLEPKKRFGPQSKNLASIIRGFKISVTKHARKIDPDFAWEAGYHDWIIRNRRAYHNMTKYILNNPRNWRR